MVVVVVIAVVVVGNTPQRVWLRIVVFPFFAFCVFTQVVGIYGPN